MISTDHIKGRFRGFTLVEVAASVTIAMIVCLAISSIAVGVMAASKNATGRRFANELTGLYFQAEGSGYASTDPSSYMGAGIVNPRDSVTYRMHVTYTPGNYSWDSSRSCFTFATSLLGGTP